MNVRGSKVLLWLLNGVLVLGIGAAGWLFLSADPTAARARAEKVDADLAKMEKDLDRRHSKGEETTRRQSDLASVWKTNLRDNAPEPPPPKVTSGKQPEAQVQIKSPLDSILSVVASFGGVVVIDLKRKIGNSPPGQYPLKLGQDEVPDLKPKTIPIRFVKDPFPGHVVFQYGDEEVLVAYQVDPDGDSSVASAPPTSEGGRKRLFGPRGARKDGEEGFEPGGAVDATDRVPGEIEVETLGQDEPLQEAREIREGLWRVPRSEYEMVKERGQELLADVNIQDYSDGQRTGVLVDYIEPGSFVDSRGFQKGDIVIKVNNYPVKSQSDLMNWVQANEKRLQNTVLVTVLRQGVEKTIQYQVQR